MSYNFGNIGPNNNHPFLKKTNATQEGGGGGSGGSYGRKRRGPHSEEQDTSIFLSAAYGKCDSFQKEEEALFDVEDVIGNFLRYVKLNIRSFFKDLSRYFFYVDKYLKNQKKKNEKNKRNPYE